MEVFSRIKSIESYLLLLAPIVGLILVVTFQMGRYAFYGVPFRLVQMDTTKIVLSALPLLTFTLASISATGNLLTENVQKGKLVFLQCIAVAAFLTLPFWISHVSITWSWMIPLAIYLLAIAGVMYSVVRFYKHLNTSGFQGKDPAGKASSIATVMFFVVASALFSTFLYGYFQESDAKSRMYLSGTFEAIVDQAGEVVILAPIDQKTGKPLRKKIRLIKIPDTGIEIEER